MKKNTTKFFAVVLVVAMLATQFVAPVFAADEGVAESVIYYCSECGDAGVLPEGEPARVVKTCKATYNIYNCANPDVTADDEEEVKCSGTITLVGEGTGEHKADGNVVAAVAPTCTVDGNVEYQGCKTCDLKLNVPAEDEELVVLESVVDPATGHDLKAVEEVPNGCLTDGTAAHTKCKTCGLLFAANAEGNPEDPTIVPSVIPGHAHNFTVYWRETPATCRETGWSSYYACSICGAIDPDRPKTELPKEDHGFHFVEDAEYSWAATCTAPGQNFFKCEKEGCPYYAGIAEELPALKHVFTDVAEVAATCTEDGLKAHKVCARECCKDMFFATDADVVTANPIDKASLVIEKLGHTEVAVDFAPATCTETGVEDAIVCDRCNYVHYAGDITPAKGHTLTEKEAKAPDCVNPGNIAYAACSACKLNFATGTKNDDLTAKALETVVVAALGHDEEVNEIAPSCTEDGWKVTTCLRKDCRYIVTEVLPATGHTAEDVAFVAPDCLKAGNEAYKKCACGQLFDVEGKEIDKIPTIDALGHESIWVDAVNPTYDAAGHTAGRKCSRCDKPLQSCVVLPELNEAVKFHFDIDAVNGDDIAVNSGYITVDIYFDVLVDALNDKEEYNSDVLANIYSITVPFNFNKDAFELTNVVVAGDFAFSAFTKVADANKAGCVKIAQDMGTADALVCTGKNIPVATLTFQVKANTAAANYNFNINGLEVVSGESDELIDTTASVMAVDLTVRMLGDANRDGVLDGNDSKKISDYIKTADLDTPYVAEYDLNKDGAINFKDLDLLRNARVGDNGYLSIKVNP